MAPPFFQTHCFVSDDQCATSYAARSSSTQISLPSFGAVSIGWRNVTPLQTVLSDHFTIHLDSALVSWCRLKCVNIKYNLNQIKCYQYGDPASVATSSSQQDGREQNRVTELRQLEFTEPHPDRWVPSFGGSGLLP